MDCSLPVSSIHGISQARVLEWVSIPFSRESFNPGIEPGSPELQEDSLLLSHQGSLQSWGAYHALNFASHWLQDQGGWLWTGARVLLSISRPMWQG